MAQSPVPDESDVDNAMAPAAAVADQLRFFGGAARLLEGKSAGEYVRISRDLDFGAVWINTRMSALDA